MNTIINTRNTIINTFVWYNYDQLTYFQYIRMVPYIFLSTVKLYILPFVSFIPAFFICHIVSAKTFLYMGRSRVAGTESRITRKHTSPGVYNLAQPECQECAYPNNVMMPQEGTFNARNFNSSPYHSKQEHACESSHKTKLQKPRQQTCLQHSAFCCPVEYKKKLQVATWLPLGMAATQCQIVRTI